MKVTEEHIEALQLLSQMRRDKFSASRFEVLKEAVEILQKQQGIQWNEYPESEPPAKGELLVLEPDGTLHLCGWRNAYNVFEVQGKKESPVGWQWAEINLPNQ